MATVKLKWRPSTTGGRPGTIYYQITHHRIVRQLKTGYKVRADEWEEICKSTTELSGNNMADEIRSIKVRLNYDLHRIHGLITEFDTHGRHYTSDDIIREFTSRTHEQTFFNFMKKTIANLRFLNKHSTAENYSTTLNSFRRFRNGLDIFTYEIDSALMMRYESHLLERGISKNTTSFYMRTLRAVYNRAVEQNLTEQHNPFRHVYTGIGKTVKRAIPLSDIKRIKNLDLPKDSGLEFARDVFLFLFYCRGMSFIDAAYLSESNLVGNDIIYRRHKTRQQLIIGINSYIRTIIDRYHVKGSKFILPILDDKRENRRLQYESALRRINNALKKIAKDAGIAFNLTTYVSRHAWASIAKAKGIQTSTISDALGHDSERTTQIYLASISNEAINRANDIILEDL